MDHSVRWCVEAPATRTSSGARGSGSPVRFTAPDGRILWADHRGTRGLGDLSDRELGDRFALSRQGAFTDL